MRPFFLCTVLCLIGCKSIAENPVSDVVALLPSASKVASDIRTDTETFAFGERRSSAWVSDTFEGAHVRRIDGDVLAFAGVQTAAEGGLDIGLSDANFGKRSIAQMSPGLVFCSSYDIDFRGEGRWWAGPKVSVNWQGVESAKGNGDDWYENYIVEIASSTPDALHEIYTGDYFKAEVLPETTVSGSVYKHYKIRFHDWWQFWSVRQDYRESGTLPIQAILDVWIENGLPIERTLDGIKANIETYGDMSGTGRMRIDLSNDPTSKLECDL